ncbi:hypothetical protein [Zavarzinella formosa]|uniref:hypothetical protein n=1 Tax=Zavarzinella formosa TaxID=360055 RepID=UPI0002E27463|nr:hypothetical protein [Zavarzinella formosa]
MGPPLSAYCEQGNLALQYRMNENLNSTNNQAVILNSIATWLCPATPGSVPKTYQYNWSRTGTPIPTYFAAIADYHPVTGTVIYLWDLVGKQPAGVTASRTLPRRTLT